MEFPKEFLLRMRDMLGGEYAAFLACLEHPPFRGVRWNPLKCDYETFEKSVPWRLSPSPFSPLCFYVQGSEKPGNLPAHHAGMFYSQEPSASCAVTALDPQPGEKILDLCAAPGGKSGQIAALTKGEGLLWSNEIVKSRANILLSNLERLGVRNSVVSSCHPQRLCQALAGFFDRVLVDAPCSGEGMFRRDPAAVLEWTPDSPAACAQRQLAVLDSAALAVKPGGVLAYSTCTFSREENEWTAAAFLKAHPDFVPLPLAASFGRPGLNGETHVRRVFPMDGGDGHFIACFQRADGTETGSWGRFSPKISKGEQQAADALYADLFTDASPEMVTRAGNRFFLLPVGLPNLAGLGVLRAGVELGECKGGRIEPAHGVFMSRPKPVCRRSLDFSPNDPGLLAFLRGEEIDCPESLRGYTAVCVSGVVTGFGKASGGRLKNRYPKGLRSFSV